MPKGSNSAPLIRAVLELYTDHAKPFLDGPALRLSSGEAGALALILCELATNSAKHGALSREGGTVRIAWSAGFEPEWEEKPSSEPRGDRLHSRSPGHRHRPRGPAREGLRGPR